MSSTQTARTPRRNEPCPCGSGKKYKYCHGASGSPAQRVASGQNLGQGAEQRFAQAFQLFQQGGFSQCADVCAAIVDSQPGHVLANHLAGLCRYQMQDFASARQWLERAAELAPDDVDVRINLVKTLVQLGEFREGEVHARRAVDLKPELAPALAALGTILIHCDELSEASPIMERAMVLGPDNPEVNAVYGDLLRSKGQMAEARQVYERCLTMDPDQVQILNNLGLVLRELGDLDRARVQLERARALSPNDVDVVNNLGELARIRGEWDVAKSLFLQSLEIDNHCAETYVYLASLFRSQGDSISAWRWLERGVEACPEDAGIRLGLAIAYAGRQKFTLAERQIEEAIRIDGENSGTALAEAAVYSHRRNPEAAAAAYSRAVELDPHNPDVLLEFAGLEEQRNHFAECAQLAARAMVLDPAREPEARIWAARAAREQRDYDAAERELASLDFASLRWEVQVNAWFELGKLRDARGDYDKAFDAFEKGAAQFRAQTPQFDLEGNIASLRKKGSETQQPDKLPRFTGATGGASTPIFIVGFMRSGTTLMEQIIASHPLVEAGDELMALSNVSLDIQEEFGDTYLQFLAELGEEGAQAQVAKWRGQYLDEVRAAGVDVERGGYFTDKFPLNLIKLPLISMAFPDAPIIHVRRNPMDCVFSNFVTNLGSPSPWAYDLEVAASYYREVLELAERYRELMAMRYLELKYEELVAEPGRVIRRVADFVGLPWDDSMLRFHENKRVARTPSHAQVNQPMYTRSVERYRHYEEFLAKPLAILEPLMRRYGYLES